VGVWKKAFCRFYQFSIRSSKYIFPLWGYCQFELQTDCTFRRDINDIITLLWKPLIAGVCNNQSTQTRKKNNNTDWIKARMPMWRGIRDNGGCKASQTRVAPFMISLTTTVRGVSKCVPCRCCILVCTPSVRWFTGLLFARVGLPVEAALGL
jgi:hypothetical protein